MKRRLGIAIVAGWLAAAGAGAAPRCTVGKIAELPVTMVGLRPMVEAEISGRPVKLMADSGAFWSVLTPGTAAELHLSLDPAPQGLIVTGVGGTADISIAQLRQFKLSGAAIPGLQFIVGGSEVGGEAGVLGENVLGIRDTEYDLGHGMIRLMEHHDCDRANLAYWPDAKQVSAIALEDPAETGRHLVGHVSVNGVRLLAVFDTGASRSGISVQAALRAGVRITDPGVVDNGMSLGVGRRMARGWVAPFRSFAIGDEEVRNIRLRIVDFGNNLPYDMLVGADFFLSHHIYAAPALRKMFFTYNGGPVFNLEPETRTATAAGPSPSASVSAAPTPAVTGDPVTADELRRRAAAAAARGGLAAALADLDRAVALAPKDAGPLLQRAGVRATLKDMAGARADADAALAIAPDDADGLLMRARLRMDGRDMAGARSDAARLADKIAAQADARLALGALYITLEEPAAAIPQFDLWIRAHPADGRLPTALNGRCWARALVGRELPQALADCNAAARRTGNAPNVLDSRALVLLRMGSLDAALADYARVLAVQPKLAWSLYGRGLARLAKGQHQEGEADIAAAASLAPDLPARARRYGIVPPG